MWIETACPEDTERAGAELAARLDPGDVVLVAGELGTGKTTFVRGACRSLGVRGPVTSPTFTIGQLYRAHRADRTLEIAHVDLYRVQEIGAEEPGLLDDYLTADRIAFVEWPAACAAVIDRPAARVTIEHAGGDRRRLEILR